MDSKPDLEKGIEEETSEKIQRGMDSKLDLGKGIEGETSEKIQRGMDSKMDLEKGIEEKTSERIQRILDGQRSEQNHPNQHSQSICGIPRDIFSEHNFEKTIGIGPLNKYRRPDAGDVKIRYMLDLFESLGFPLDDIRNECAHRVCSKFDQIKACYGHHLNSIKSEIDSIEMCMIIVVDACYILSLVYKWSNYNRRNTDKFLGSFQTKRDLIVVDNQIPFFVLQDIFDCIILKRHPTASLQKLILSFLEEIITFEANSKTALHGTSYIDCKHILDLVYKTYQPPDARSSDSLSTMTATYSAVQLAKAGVKFEPAGNEMTIKFKSSWGNATLTMPAMRIDESTGPVLCNLTVYERRFPEVGSYIASYNFAIMMLVNTKEDLLKLGESKIVRNLTGHQYIMDLIHTLCKGVALTEFSYAKEWRKMDDYCNSFLGYTRRTYFSGAWSYIASVSALILFALTMIQTYCDIRGL